MQNTNETLKRVHLAARIMVIIALGLVGVLVLGGTNSKLNRLKQEREELTQELVYSTECADALARGEARLATLNARLEALGERIPVAMDFEQFYDQLSMAATQSGISITHTQTESPVTGESAIALPIQIDAEGSANSFVHFLRRLSEFSRLTTLRHVQIAPMSKSTSLHYSLELNVFAERPPE